jgi:hypothetical protein
MPKALIQPAFGQIPARVRMSTLQAYAQHVLLRGISFLLELMTGHIT